MVSQLTHPALTHIVDVFDQIDLFESLNNDRIVELSKLGNQSGFSSIDAIRRSTGISNRRILATGRTAIDLAERLINRLESTTGIMLGDFAKVFLCHSHTSGQEVVDLASTLTRRHELPRSLIQPVNYGCCGFLKMLQDGAEWLESHRSPNTRIAILAVETPETWHDGSDRLFCGIVSAGAAAAVLQGIPGIDADVSGSQTGLPFSVIRADDFKIPVERRPNSNPLFHKEWADCFTFRGESSYRNVMRMNAEPVFLNGIELMLNNLRNAIMSIDRQPGERVIVLPHQPSGKLLRALIATARQEFPDFQFLNNLDQYGNTISCSVPTILSRLDQVLAANQFPPVQQGDHIILLAAGICMAEIENHMSAGHACFRWVNGILNCQVAPANNSSRVEAKSVSVPNQT
ncbi:MAG: 3-oxoacyl-[acyl-carrier-protein] synthase III C-terminal domain-containing protein [Planctomycetaceae bacterium]